MKRNDLPVTIWLIPDGPPDDPETQWSWCDDPAPAAEMEECDAVKYVKGEDE